MNRKLLSLALAGLALALPAAVLADPQYTIESLTYPGGDAPTPTSIAGGFISGNAYSETGLNAALWTQAGVQTLVGPAGSTLLGVSAVNYLGSAVGTAGAGRTPPQAIIWKNGVAEYLPQEDDDADDTEFLYASRANGINGKGTVMGNAETQYGDVGVVWDTNGVHLLMSLDPISEYQHSVAMSINNLDQVTGAADLAGHGRQAVIWENGAIHQIGGLGDIGAGADINDLGHVVGWTTNEAGGTSGFFFDGTTTTLLPTLPGLFYGDAAAINNAGLIVGYSAPEGVEEATATLWKDGQAYSLNSLLGGSNDSTWNLVSATDISEDGTIVGFGYHNGEYAAFVMKPVPEPATMAALGLGVAALLRRRRK